MLSNSASLDPYVPTPGAAPSSTAYYGPRFDYDPVTLQPRGLLIEEARTNLLTYSEQFDNAAWATKTNITITPNAGTSPTGAPTADLVDDGTAAGAQHKLFGAPYTFSATAYTYSVYAKYNSMQWFQLLITDGTTNFYANFDVLNGAVGSKQASTTSTITSVGGGWYRCTMTMTTAATTGNYQIGFLDIDRASFAPTYAGANRLILIWGAQLEAGAFATSYIPTIASTVTRSADVATITGSLFSQWYNQSEGGFIVEADTVQSVDPSATAASDGTLNNRIQLFFGAASHLFVRVGGVTQADLDAGSITLNTPAKLAAAYKLNDFAASLNGGAAVTDTSGSLPTADRLSIGTNPSAAAQLNGHIRSIRYVPVRAADFQLQQVTT
jgi:hypothetical protein